MSRVGKQPVTLPSGVDAAINGNQITISGPKGKMVYTHAAGVTVSKDGQKVIVKPSGDSKQIKATYGATRAHINNMVKGVTEMWRRSLLIEGVGFTANVQGKKLVLKVGYSHEVVMELPPAIICKTGKNDINLESTDKELLGIFAARIRKACPPEPYKGKGIRYADERIRRKAGKTGK